MKKYGFYFNAYDGIKEQLGVILTSRRINKFRFHGKFKQICLHFHRELIYLNHPRPVSEVRRLVMFVLMFRRRGK